MSGPAILLLSPYDTSSHQYWRRSLQASLSALLEAEVTTLTLPPRHFSWRQRGNSLTFAAEPALAGGHDLVIATSMTDLSALRGLNRTIADTPAIVYFHENQFAYPDRGTEGLVERQLTSIYTALSADRVVFNSRWNRDSFMTGARQLLNRMPDGVPPDVSQRLADRSRVIPVALPELKADRRTRSGERLRIVWNHRFEYDKGPALLLAIVEGLLASTIPFEFSLLGERYRQRPPEMDRVIERLQHEHKLAHDGYIDDRATYLDFLATQDVVLSTTDHEFQGLAVQEALLSGCLPLLPDRLVYPEYVPASHRYRGADDAVARLQVGLADYDLSLLAPYREAAVSRQWLTLIDELI